MTNINQNVQLIETTQHGTKVYKLSNNYMLTINTKFGQTVLGKAENWHAEGTIDQTQSFTVIWEGSFSESSNLSLDGMLRFDNQNSFYRLKYLSSSLSQALAEAKEAMLIEYSKF